MDLLKALRAYSQVVESGGFAAAARELGTSRAIISKQVQQLEGELGTQLLRRSTRVVTPTETGLAFYERCRGIVDDLDGAVNEVSQLQGEIRGNLRVNVPMSFGLLYMGKIVSGFMARYPDVHVELSLNDRFVDLIEEGFDVTVRIAESESLTSVVCESISSTELLLCASPAFAMKHSLALPEDLRVVRCLHYGLQQTGVHWKLEGPAGEVSTRVNCVMWSNNGQVLKEAALQHQGVAMLPDFIAGPELQEGLLQRVLPEYTGQTLDVSLLYPRHRHLSDKVRTFIEFARDHFAGRPPWSLVT